MDLNTLLVAGALSLPLQQADAWQLLQYDGLQPNRVEFSNAGMQVHVDRSASPIIYPLPAPLRVERVSVSGSLDGLLDVESGRQGQRGNDDFGLKLGLVVAGDKTLNRVQRWFSPGWVRRLHEMAPAGVGIDRDLFLNAVQFEPQLGAARQHPLSPLLRERNAWLIDRSGPFELHYELDQALDVVAVWLSIDGDDSASRYSILIDDLRLQTRDRDVGDRRAANNGFVARAEGRNGQAIR